MLLNEGFQMRKTPTSHPLVASGFFVRFSLLIVQEALIHCTSVQEK